MKKYLSFVLMLVLVASLLLVPSMAYGQSEFKVTVNEEIIGFKVPLISENNRILVPLEGVFEKLGAEARRDKENPDKIFISDQFTTVELTLGSKEGLVHKKYDFSGIPLKVTLDAAPRIVNGSVYVPLRFVCESLDTIVEWNEKTRTAAVRTQGDIIQVEKPAEYSILDEAAVNEKIGFAGWYEDQSKVKGIHSYREGSSLYVLISAGEKPTGGYGIEIESATLVNPGSLYVTAAVSKPAPDSMVTMAITYPSVLLRLENTDITVVDGEIIE